MTLNIWPNSECATPRLNPNVIYGLWVRMISQYSFLSCNTCTTPMGDLIIGEPVHEEQGMAVGKTSALPFKFAVTLTAVNTVY